MSTDTSSKATYSCLVSSITSIFSATSILCLDYDNDTEFESASSIEAFFSFYNKMIVW